MLSVSDFTTPSFLGNSITLKVPGAVHHGLEVLVFVNGHGDVVVVLDPFWHGDKSISGITLSSNITVVIFKSVKELSKDLIFSFLSGFDVWMLLGVVGLSDVVNVKLSTLVGIHDVVSFLSESNSLCVHLTSDSSEELIIRDLTTAISVENLESLKNLLIVETDSEV